MTNAQVLAKTVAMADNWLRRELAAAEITLIDCNATGAEIEAAIGPGGSMRRLLEAGRAEQIAEVTAWLAGTDAVLH